MVYKRRHFLRDVTLGGSSLAMAPVPSNGSSACERKGIPLLKRFVFVVKSSGIDKFNLVPDGLTNHFVHEDSGEKLGNRSRREGPMVDVSLSDHKLPEKLASLEDFKDHLTILQSLSGVGFRGNHTKGFGTFHYTTQRK